MTEQKIYTENDYAHWLFNVPGLGNRGIDKLLCNGMNCREVFEADAKEFKGIITDKQIKSLEQIKRNWDFEKENRKLEQKGISFISRIDERFPEKLKNIPDPPFALYVKGELPDPKKPCVAIIGARMCSEYGRYMARNFGRGLALAGVQVISGMARGVDGISQKAALEAGGKSFGIVGSGVDICYPDENLEVYKNLCANGGIISEFPPGTYPKANFFPMRNRIISGLADVVLVIEAREKSGTQITVDTALEQGRDVLAVPGRVTDRLSDGCNLLISQGAGVALGIDDVLGRLWEVKREEKSQENENDCDASNPVLMRDKPRSVEDEIIDILDVIPMSSSQILENLYSREIELSIPQLMNHLMELNYQGRIIQEGVYYRKKMDA
jgi:DNA processing protein